jgi:hypothetical protein
MNATRLQVGKVVRSMRDIPLARNVHVKVLSSAAPQILPKGTEAEVVGLTPTHVQLNCKDGHGHGPDAWGLKIAIANVVWGISFE